jgi:hypothetical protein
MTKWGAKKCHPEPACRQAGLFQDLFQHRFQNHIGLMDSGSGAGMTKRVTSLKYIQGRL